MNQRLIIGTLTVLAVVALHSAVLLVPAPALAAGATHIAGLGVYAAAGDCEDPAGDGDSYALTLTGDLDGCLYTFVETADCSPSGTYRETGRELFVGQYTGQDGTFRTTYRFTAKYEECVDDIPVGELFGRCQHPIIAGSGTGVFAGVSGRLDFKDDIAAENFPYRGHLRWSSSVISQQVRAADTRC